LANEGENDVAGRLKDKVAFITGIGSSGPGWGTGKAIAAMFASEGAAVFGFDKSEQAAAETKAIIEQDGGQCTIFQGDVTSATDVGRAVDRCADVYGRVDIVVNNVGIGAPGGVVEQSEESWDDVFAVNLKSVFHTCKRCIPLMISGGGGAIVNIASIAAVRWVGVPMISYASSKAAMVQMTKHIALQHARQKIRANVILPGLIETPMIVEPLKQYYGDDVPRFLDIRDRTCPGGKMGSAHDIAYAAVYLASDEARFVSGAELVVDGGISNQIAAPEDSLNAASHEPAPTGAGR
jgi:NAD(P)-dependent dehydrogenase (short-subunit alcohol dehydrogenase family)